MSLKQRVETEERLGLRRWPHSPAHNLRCAGTYIVTAATYQHAAIFQGVQRLTLLTNLVLELGERYAWALQAWAVFSNHYHLLGQAREAESLRPFLRHLHSVTAIAMNKADRTPGRKVWFEFWETRITFQRSYLARLNYVHQNPVHHGLVRLASQYPWCSAGWFERKSDRSFYQVVSAFKADTVTVPDDIKVPPID